MKKLFPLVLLLLTICNALKAQQEIKLYSPAPAENNELNVPEGFRDQGFVVNVSEARMYVYPASNPNGTAVVICPGGGYGGLAFIHEGSDIAKWLNQLGVTAFVLYYRMPNGHTTIPLTDAQKALSIVRARAKEWKINKNKIGIMGFSAGGHLASTVGTHFKNKEQRPSFMILGYPVVTMKKDLTHSGSRENLLGKDPSEALVDLYSNEMQVTKKTPPTFIVHAKDDKVVPIENSLQLKAALEAKGVPVEMQVYDEGGHGFGMKKKDLPVEHWPETLKKWLVNQKLITL